MYGNARNIKKKYIKIEIIFYQDFLIIFSETRIYIKSVYQFSRTSCIRLRMKDTRTKIFEK